MDKVATRDIETADDVALLVRQFYSKVYQDPVLRPVFADVAKVDLEEHLPKMNRFWGTILLDEGSYRGHPMRTHHQLDSKVTLHECHYLRWQALFCQTVDELFSGPRSAQAKETALRINKSIEWTLSRNRRSLFGPADLLP